MDTENFMFKVITLPKCCLTKYIILKSFENKINMPQSDNRTAAVIPPPFEFSDGEAPNRVAGAELKTNDNSAWETTDDELVTPVFKNKLSYRDATLRFITPKSKPANRDDKRKKKKIITKSFTEPRPSNIKCNIPQENDFTLVESKSNRRRRLNYVDNFSGAPTPKTYIFVSRVRSGNEEIIKEYLKDNNILIDDINMVSHENSKFKSFRISICKYDLNRVRERDFWPNGIKCNLWNDKNIRNRQFYNSRYNDSKSLF